MHILYSNYYITFIILSILVYQYQAFESNVKSGDFESLNLFQNDLSSKNIINQDSIISSLNRNDEINYLQKKQANSKNRQKESKKSNSRKPSRSKITTRKKLSTGKITPRKIAPKKTTPRKTTPRKTTPKKKTPKIITPRKTTKKPPMQKTTSKVPPKNKTTTKKPTTTTTKPKKKLKVTTTRKSKTIKTVATKPLPVKPVVTTSSTRTPTTTTSVTTTEKPDDLSKFVKKTIYDINALRAKFNRTELKVSDVLTKEAQNYSDYFVRISDELEPYKHDGRLKYLLFNEILNTFNAVNYWASDNNGIVIEDSKEKLKYPTFRQLIARNATHIGCGINQNEYLTALFCRIKPPLDIDGEYFDEEDDADEEELYRESNELLSESSKDDSIMR